ncbi:hypothetical protein TSAR_000995 [Trichomalopsis sarcophagae]|uniref:DUF4817 domain-containing protein n=1 Tax=Trichomalopsis sarcophagae TaxID=543379 RepID=A0A232FHH1_9HYME|nr:hypothetical protein TSAR_000995 [Trichomalopsis sarcophagae]
MRIAFCRWALQTIENDLNFFYYVLFSDKAKFYSDEQLNRHNCHYWPNENPHWHRTVDHQHRWSLMLIRDQLPVLLEDVDLETRRRMWFQQNGAAPHFALIVQQFLNQNYRGRWIGRGGPVNWLPNSPDLTSLDFYLWGYLKNVVFEERPTTKEDMQDYIRQTCAAIPRQNLLNTVRHFQRRLSLCLQANGGNFEQLLHG